MADGATLVRLCATSQNPNARRTALRTLMRDSDTLLRPLGLTPHFLVPVQDATLLAGSAFAQRNVVWEVLLARSKLADLPAIVSQLGLLGRS